MRILALDIGDVWTGSAISDELGMLAAPHKTVETFLLDDFLKSTILQHDLKIIVVGYPGTLRGTESEQTKKVKKIKEALEQKFSSIEWIFWDERLTSKQAEQLKKVRSHDKEGKRKLHSIAAAFILSGYLESRTTG